VHTAIEVADTDGEDAKPLLRTFDHPALWRMLMSFQAPFH
jgi:hypothetical protein